MTEREKATESTMRCERDHLLSWLREVLDGLDGVDVHIVVEHAVTQDEVDDVVSNPRNPTAESDSSGRPITFGWTSTGRHIAVVWEVVCDDPKMIRVRTAYDTPPKRRRS